MDYYDLWGLPAYLRFSAGVEDDLCRTGQGSGKESLGLHVFQRLAQPARGLGVVQGTGQPATSANSSQSSHCPPLFSSMSLWQWSPLEVAVSGCCQHDSAELQASD